MPATWPVSGVRVRLQKDMSLPAPPPHEERTSPALDSTLADIGVPTRIERLRAEGDVTYIEHHPGLPDREFMVKTASPSPATDLAIDASKAGRPVVPFLAQRLTLVLTDIDRHWGKVRSASPWAGSPPTSPTPPSRSTASASRPITRRSPGAPACGWRSTACG